MLATIETIKEVKNHPNADRLDIVTVNNFQCIVKKNTWEQGDTCVLIQPDTILPDVPWAEFYKSSSSRVKAVRLRGEWSFGIVEHPVTLGVENLPIGTEVSDLIGVTKYEPPEPSDLQTLRMRLPYGIPKTDETLWQNLRDIPFGEKVTITQKIDGQSATYYMKDGQFGITSRKIELKPGVSNNYTAHVKRYDIENKLRDYYEKYGVNIALRGESYGEGIQGVKNNPHSKMKKDIAFFSVYLIDEGRYASPFEKHSVWNVCQELDLPTVPLLETGELTQELLDKWRNENRIDGKLFEGVVFTGNGFSFKVMNMEYDSHK